MVVFIKEFVWLVALETDIEMVKLGLWPFPVSSCFHSNCSASQKCFLFQFLFLFSSRKKWIHLTKYRAWAISMNSVFCFLFLFFVSLVTLLFDCTLYQQEMPHLMQERVFFIKNVDKELPKCCFLSNKIFCQYLIVKRIWLFLCVVSRLPLSVWDDKLEDDASWAKVLNSWQITQCLVIPLNYKSILLCCDSAARINILKEFCLRCAWHFFSFIWPDLTF